MVVFNILLRNRVYPHIYKFLSSVVMSVIRICSCFFNSYFCVSAITVSQILSFSFIFLSYFTTKKTQGCVHGVLETFDLVELIFPIEISVSSILMMQKRQWSFCDIHSVWYPWCDSKTSEKVNTMLKLLVINAFNLFSFAKRNLPQLLMLFIKSFVSPSELPSPIWSIQVRLALLVRKM